MKNALVIGATEDSVFSMNFARKYGYRIFAIDGNKEAKGLECADYSYVVDINDRMKVFEITDSFKPDIVLPAPIGHCLTTVGAVNDRYGLKGVTQESAEICTDKFLFNEMLNKAHLRNGGTVLYKKGSAIDVSDFNEPNSFPLIVKPRYGSGSREVEVLKDYDSLRDWIARNSCLKEDIVFEKCVAGKEYGIDGAFIDGTFFLTLLRKKKNTEIPYRQCVGYISVPANEDILFWNKCKNLMQETGKVLKFKDCIIHADIIKTVDGDPFIIETSARPSGHNLSTYFTPKVTGVVLVDEFIKYAGLEKYSFEATETKKMMIRFFDFEEGTVIKVPQKEEILKIPGVVDYVCNIRENDYLGKVLNGASIMGRGYYLIEAERETELENIDNFIREKFIIKKEEDLR